MKYKKIFFLVFATLTFLNGFSQTKKTTPTGKNTTTEKPAVLTDKKLPADNKNLAMPEKKTVSAKEIPSDKKVVFVDKIVAVDDSIKVKVIDADSITNKSLKFKPFKKAVHVSYYHDKFNGKKTASGIKFSNQKYTAAHRKLPFGTKVKVINPENGKFVIVEVQDRGPFTRGREIDITKKAFLELVDNKNTGGLKVDIEVEK